jgi:hypothetical protein
LHSFSSCLLSCAEIPRLGILVFSAVAGFVHEEFGKADREREREREREKKREEGQDDEGSGAEAASFGSSFGLFWFFFLVLYGGCSFCT